VRGRAEASALPGGWLPGWPRGGMADDDALWGSPTELVTLEELKTAQAALKTYPDVLRTPLLPSWPIGGSTISLKLESLQTTGSFKIRGMRYKLHVSDVEQLRSAGVVTLSAGNAGKAVSYLGQATGYKAKVFMPETAPDDRKVMMEGMGSTVVKVPGSELLDAVAQCIAEEKRILVHPFDDVELIRGHASCGLEILEDMPDVDVVVVCCGGGGLLAGVAAAIKLSGSKARVVGVEPVGAQSMALSVASGAAEWCPEGGKTETIAHGLAPPFAGRSCYNHVSEFVDEVVTVSDDEMREATRQLFLTGIVAEVSGAAAVAAVLTGKLGDLEGKKVACTVSGRNIDIDEFEHAISNRPMSHM
jgi:threonine dehydratase